MEAVFCFVPDDGLGADDHLCGDFFAPMGRQAMQEERLRASGIHRRLFEQNLLQEPAFVNESRTGVDA